MGGVIEILLPRYSITPLDRTDDEYWRQSTKQSILKGGTWTAFNWNQLATGHATQRIQYSSDLRIPQAEVSLEELFDYMLDRGAVPDTKGIHMLRVSGLWTPTGTCLMLSPDSSQVALRISMPDDSDGVLSMALQWKPEWNKRDHSSLPPGWMRLDFPTTMGRKEGSSLDDYERPVEPADTASDEILDDREKPEVLERKESSNPPAYIPLPTALRFHLSSLPSHPYVQLKDPTYEHNNMPLSPAPKSLGTLINAATPWLAPLCLALSLSHSYPTSFLNLPTFLYSLSSSSSIPCGVLVMANLLSSNDAPEWETIYSADEQAHEQQQQFRASQQALARERTLPDGQRQQAQTLRAQEELTERRMRAMRFQRESTERAERREREALGSPKMGVDLVVNAALAVLQAEGSIAIPETDDEARTGEKDVCQVAVERLVVGIYEASSGIDLTKNEWALDVCEMLDRWRDWSSRGGMNKEDLRLIVSDRKAFCWAVTAVGLVTRVCEKEKADGGGLLGDVRECLRVWKKVRLG
ncbi:MAG: hypothetical protein Q9184_007693 [Pyrenodesmia sp. 2 TL-2023]